MVQEFCIWVPPPLPQERERLRWKNPSISQVCVLSAKHRYLCFKKREREFLYRPLFYFFSLSLVALEKLPHFNDWIRAWGWLWRSLQRGKYTEIDSLISLYFLCRSKKESVMMLCHSVLRERLMHIYLFEIDKTPYFLAGGLQMIDRYGRGLSWENDASQRLLDPVCFVTSHSISHSKRQLMCVVRMRTSLV